MTRIALILAALLAAACMSDDDTATPGPADAAVDAFLADADGDAARADGAIPDDASLPEGGTADQVYALSLAYCTHVVACQEPLPLDINRCAYLSTIRICQGRDCGDDATREEDAALCLDTLRDWTTGVTEDHDRTTCGNFPTECRGLI